MKIPWNIPLDDGWTLTPLPAGDRAPGICPPEDVAVAAAVRVPGAIDTEPSGGWLYRRRLSLPESVPGTTLRIRFAAVRGRAEVFLNGRLVGQCPGEGLPAEFPLTDAWLPGKENRLAVALCPPRGERGRAPSRLGLTGAVELSIAGEAWFRDVAVHANLAMDRREAALSVVGQFAARERTPAACIVEIIQDGLPVVAVEDAATLFPGDTVLVQSVTVPRPRLWWPRGMGEQPLYEARLALVAQDGRVLDRRALRFGIRDIRVEDAAVGTSAHLAVNGRSVWLQGWEWRPPEPPPHHDDDERYEGFPTLAAAAGANLLHIDLAAGLETERFYAACDRVGILVWQPFPTAPDLDTRDGCTADDLRAWAEAVTAARRHHPSLAVWGLPPGLPPELEAELRDEDPQRAWLPGKSLPESGTDEPGFGLPIRRETFGPLCILRQWRMSARSPYRRADDLLARCFDGLDDPERQRRAITWLGALLLGQAIERVRRRRGDAAGFLLGPLQAAALDPTGGCLVDEAGRPLAAFYAARRALRPVLVSADADPHGWERSPAYRTDALLHSAGEDVALLNVVATIVDLRGRVHYQENLAAEAEAGRVVIAGDISWRFPDGDDFYLLRLELVDEESRTLAESWAPISRAPEPWLAPLLELSETGLQVESVAGGVLVRNTGPVVAFDVRLEGDGLSVADSGLILLPGASAEVPVDGCGELAVDAWNADRRTLTYPASE